MLYHVYVDFVFFFFKQKTAYEMRISDWSSDVCSSDLPLHKPTDLPKPLLPSPLIRLIKPTSTAPSACRFLQRKSPFAMRPARICPKAKVARLRCGGLK